MRNGVVLFAAALVVAIMLYSSNCCLAAPTVEITPAVDNDLLINPGKGFVQYYGPNDSVTPTFIGAGYTRMNWSDVEPEENVYNWKPIDDFIQAFATYHRKIAFGVLNVSTGVGHEYVTPKWVFDDGAVPLTIEDTSTPSKTQIIPKSWDDPVFLAKLEAFVKVLGQRYDGNPNILWIDIRSYGNWGEGHIGGLGHDVVMASPDVLQADYFQPYFDAFPHTQLIIPWGSDEYAGVYDRAVLHGVGMRRDGILSQWSKNGSECARAFDHAPAVFEYCNSYATTKKNGYWSTDNLLNYVAHGKPSYLQWDTQIYKENPDFILKLGNVIGYHFVLQSATLPATIRAGRPFHVQFAWLNDGVAPVYVPCHVAMALLDQNDNVMQRAWLPESKPSSWQPSTTTVESLQSTFAHMPQGTYKLAVGLFTDPANAAPDFQLGIQGKTEDGWYVLNPNQKVDR